MQPMIDRIGGEAGVQALVTQFYDLIETLPQGAAILAMHQRGHGLAHARPAQFEFLCGFFGGRRYHSERNGAVSLREMHAHIDIRAGQPMQTDIMATFRRAAHKLVNVA